MIKAIARAIFGTSNDRKLKIYRARVNEINAMEPSMMSLSDDALAHQTTIMRDHYIAGQSLDSLLPQAFAVAREASRRILGLRPFDVQLVGGIALHDGRIAEMKTGEGKTLVATMPAYLHAISGAPVHIVTVNDYLARRDAEWMRRLYNFLGLSVGVILQGQSDIDKRQEYKSDVIYATNNELGFDYLRDNMKLSIEDTVQGRLSFAIIDEVDSILIDEARTPLIISGPEATNSSLYLAINPLVRRLVQSADNYELDEKRHIAILTENGLAAIEHFLAESDILRDGGLFDLANIEIAHHVNQALRAHLLFRRDTQYVIKDERVLLVDEFTGRMMPGRRYSEGLHQALEAKEGVPVQPENQTLATITFQNFFRLYEKLAGMTGTAATEADEFMEIYKLDVVEVPPNQPIRRIDDNDEVYRTDLEKFDALVKAVVECRAHRQPLLIGTTSIEKSEKISERLRMLGIPHSVLNARFHDEEADIIAQAGVPGAVTIATNMAGRGTDIQLGGVPQTSNEASSDESRRIALEAGGLFVIGTERHESRRIDNQLRGRSGRQGDPGRSRFLLSLDDDLMRVFGSDRMTAFLSRLGLRDGEAIAHPWVSKALEKAQQKVEAKNFEMRRNILRYDDVMDSQRREMYRQRRTLVAAEDVHPIIGDIVRDLIDSLLQRYAPASLRNLDGLGKMESDITRIFGVSVSFPPFDGTEVRSDVVSSMYHRCLEVVLAPWADVVESVANRLQRYLVVQCLDEAWVQHLHTLELIRQGIGLRAYGQRDPLSEFKVEAYAAFEAMLNTMREQICIGLRAALPLLKSSDDAPSGVLPSPRWNDYEFVTASDQIVSSSASALASAPIARNLPCPCGSGKKFKHCHGLII